MQADPRQQADPRRAALWLFAGLALLYAAMTGGHVYSPDGVVMARVTESLVERGELAVPDRGYPPGFLAPGAGGRLYGKYGLGLSFAAVPGYLLGRGLAGVAPAGVEAAFVGPRFLWYDAGDRGEALRFFGMSLTNAAVAAAACALLYLLALEVGLPAGTALLAFGVAAGASPLLVYGKSFFSEPLAALGLTAAAWALARWRRSPRWSLAAAAGAGLGLAVLAKVAHAVLVPPVAIAALLLARDVALPRRRLAAHAAAATAALALFLVTVAALNAARFGSPFATGYEAELDSWTTPWRTGLAGLLVSPGRGLLPYFPAALLALAAPRALARGARWPVVLGGACLAALLLLYGRWHGWDGGWCWGPRFLVPVMPLLALGAAAWLRGPDAHRAGGRAPGIDVGRWGGGALLAASAAINWTGTLVPFTEYHHALRQVVGPGAYLDVARWSWAAWPPRVYWSMPKSYWLLGTAAAVPAARWLVAGLVAALLLGALAVAVGCRRALAAPSAAA